MNDFTIGLLICGIIVFGIYKLLAKEIKNSEYVSVNSKDNALELAYRIMKYAKLKISNCVYSSSAVIVYRVRYSTGLWLEYSHGIAQDTYKVYLNEIKIATWKCYSDDYISKKDFHYLESLFTEEALKPYFEVL